MPENPGESYYIQVSESIKSIYELTARVDERQQLMMAKVEQLETKLDNIFKEYKGLDGRVLVIESKGNGPVDLAQVREELHKQDVRLHDLEISSKGQEGRWRNVFSFITNLVWVVLAAYILYKLGIQAPDIP